MKTAPYTGAGRRKMTLSVDSSNTQSACLTRSTREKRDSFSVQSESGGVCKKFRSISPLSETSPQRPRPCNSTEIRLSQESAKTKTALCFPGPTPGGPGDTPADLLETYFDGDLHAAIRPRNGSGRTSATEKISVRAMILHSQQLAHATLLEYEKEREEAIAQNSEAAAEGTRLQERNKAAAEEIESLRSMNAELGRREAATAAQLQELHENHIERDGVLVAAALAVSKALMLGEKAVNRSVTSLKIGRLRAENQKLLKERADGEEAGKSELMALQVNNGEIQQALSEIQAERSKLIKELEQIKAASNLASQDFLSQVAAANAEIDSMRFELEISTMEKTKFELEKQKAQEGVLELGKMLAQKDTRLEDVQVQLQSVVEKCACLEGQQSELLLEKEKLSQRIAESELLAKEKVEQLVSSNEALLKEHDNARATLHQTMRQCSELDSIVYQLRTLQAEKDTEMDSLRSELAKKGSELIATNAKLTHMILKKREGDLQTAAEIQKLTKERAESQAREEAAMLKIRSMTLTAESHSKMHLAFLINCGMMQRDNFDSLLLPSDITQNLTCPR